MVRILYFVPHHITRNGEQELRAGWNEWRTGHGYGDTDHELIPGVGRFLPHTKSTLPTTKIDGQLRGLNKSKWVQVDEMDLDSATRQAVTTKTAEVKGVQKS